MAPLIQDNGTVPIVSLENSTFWFGENKKKQLILSNIDLAVYKGDLITIEGPSGSGKTTLLNLICGFLYPQKGKIFFNKYAIRWLPDFWIARFRGKNFGFVFQDYRLLSRYSVWENIILPLYFCARLNSKNLEYGKFVCRKLGIEHLLSRKPLTLSGGEKQRVGIARALVNKPSLVLADEPTGNLDKDNAKAVKNLLRETHKEFHHALVMVTHDTVLSKLGKRRFLLKEKTLQKIQY